MGFGLAFVIPFWNILSKFADALVAWFFIEAINGGAGRYTIPVASGLIAGESFMGVFITVLVATHAAK
jgi:uncharacterized oligopeptide transporter (OPT) family protein